MLKPIVLNREEEVSPLLNIDALTTKQKELIDYSVAQQEIYLLDSDDNILKQRIEEVKDSNPNFIPSKKPIEQNKAIEIPSVTQPLEEEEEIEESLVIDEEIYENVTLLLKQNGNTVKKTIKNLQKDKDTLLFLHACLELETKGQNRRSVISITQDKLMEI